MHYLRRRLLLQVSDNKLALKLFGNKTAVQKEKLRQKAGGTFVIHPCSDFRFSKLLSMFSARP